MVQPVYYSPVHTQQNSWKPETMYFLILKYTASKFDILDDFCVIKKILFTRSFDPYHNNQPFIKIGKSSKLFMQDCPIPMCAFCTVAWFAWGARFGKCIGRQCAPHALQLKTR